MASSSEQTADHVTTQLAILQERLRVLEEENQVMRNSNITLKKQLEQISSTSQHRDTLSHPSNPAIPTNILGVFNNMVSDNPPADNHPPI